MTEDKMVEWHYQHNGYEFEQALGDGKGQGGQAYCSPWEHKESDKIQQLNNKISTSKTVESYGSYTVSFIDETSYSYPQWLHQFTILSTVY